MSKNKHTPAVDIGERRAAAQTGVSRRTAAAGLLIFYLAAAILNGQHLYDTAAKRPYGRVRDAWLMVLTPTRGIARLLCADRLRATVENIRNMEK